MSTASHHGRIEPAIVCRGAYSIALRAPCNRGEQLGCCKRGGNGWYREQRGKCRTISSRGRRWPSSDPAAPGSRPSFPCCCASTIHSAAACASVPSLGAAPEGVPGSEAMRPLQGPGSTTRPRVFFLRRFFLQRAPGASVRRPPARCALPVFRPVFSPGGAGCLILVGVAGPFRLFISVHHCPSPGVSTGDSSACPP